MYLGSLYSSSDRGKKKIQHSLQNFFAAGIFKLRGLQVAVLASVRRHQGM